MAITGISSYDGKQIIAAGAQSAIKAYQDSNGDVITSKYQTTAGMSDYATTASVTGKQDTLTFGYTDDQISQINGSGIYSQGGGGGGVVTATGGTTDYVQTINGKNISATNAGSALSATDAYNLTNTAIKVASAGSASTAYYATNAYNGVSLINIYNSAVSGYRAFTALTGTSGYTHYSQSNNAGWWSSTANNPMHVVINTANWSSGGTVSDAHLFLTQKNANESAFHITLRIGGDWKLKGSWTQYTFATLGGSTYFCDNGVQMQYIEWSNSPVMIVKNGGWNTLATATVFDAKTGTGQTATFVWDGVVSRA